MGTHGGPSKYWGCSLQLSRAEESAGTVSSAAVAWNGTADLLWPTIVAPPPRPHLVHLVSLSLPPPPPPPRTTHLTRPTRQRARASCWQTRPHLLQTFVGSSEATSKISAWPVNSLSRCVCAVHCSLWTTGTCQYVPRNCESSLCRLTNLCYCTTRPPRSAIKC